MSEVSWLWLCLASYAVHVLEEFVFDWRTWAERVLKLPVRWEDFYITNALVVVLGIVAAMIAPVCPVIALSFAGLMLVNATFFHIGPFLWTRGRFSPGLITAVLLFLPVGTMTFLAVHLSVGAQLEALGLGALLMATPIAFMKLAAAPYFDQKR